MNTLLKRIISLVLCLVMVVGYVPVNVFADETGEAVSTEAPEVTPDAPAVVTDEESEPEIPEAPKPEAPKPEAPKPEAPKPEAPKPEAPKPKAPKPEAPKPEAPKPEAPKPEAPKPEAPKPEAPKPEAPKPEAPKPEAPKTEPEEPEAPKTEQEEPPVTEEIVPSVIAVTGITLDQTALEVTVGELPMTLTATVQPEDATDKTVTWTSSEPGVASVENGVLTFGYMGEAVITATAGEFSASCTVTVGEGEAVTFLPEKFVDAAIFFSDLHTSKSDYKKSTVKGIMNGLNSSGLSFSSVTSCGDAFSVNEGSGYTGYTSTITGYIQSVFTGIPVSYVWSDHDRYAVEADNTTLLNKTSRLVYGAGTDGVYGTDDDGNYYVYSLSMGDLCSYDRYSTGFNYKTSNNSGRINAGFTPTVAKAIENFKADTAVLKKDRPLFIASHQPLFDNRNDNAWAEDWFDAINTVAEKMDVAYFYGHNHKYDSGSDYYYAKGTQMPVATADGWNYNYEIGQGYKPSVDLPAESKTLNFSHMCAGYLAPSSTGSTSNTTREGTAVAVTILEDSISYVTYNKDGIYNGSFALNETVARAHANDDTELPGGNQGGNEGGGETPDDTVIPEGYALARVEVVNQGTTKYFLNDALDTENLVVEAVYTKEDAADVRKVLTLQTAENEDGYTVSGFDMSNAGKQYVTVTYNGFTGSYAIEVFKTRFENEAGTVAVDFTNLGITSVAITEEPKEVEGYTAYVTYDITPVGYTQGDEATVTIALDTSLFDVTRPVKVLDQGNVIATPAIEDGKITFTTNHFSEYDAVQTDDTGADVDSTKWTEVVPASGGTTTYTYTLDTDGTIDANTKYLIVSANSGSGNALTNNNGSASSTPVSISDSTISVTDDSKIAWTFSANNGGKVTNGNRGLRLSSTGGFLSTTTNDMVVASKGNGGYTIQRQGQNYYVRHNNGSWSRNRTASTLYLYALTDSDTTGGTPATYAQAVGPTTYQVALGTSAADALAAVKNGMTVYTANADNAITGTLVPDNNSNLTWTWASTYNPNTLGEYNVTIRYNNVVLATVTVEVVTRVAQSIELVQSEGSVERDSGATANTGAQLKVTWQDGTIEQVPVTVGMLSGSHNVKKNGTYTGLTVSYAGTDIGGFTLNVVNKSGLNDYPLYPNPGSVDLKKSATGVDFQNTGIAHVELSASGLPSEKGVDVIVMLDLSSSMNRCIAHDDKTCTVRGCKTRLEELEDAMQTFEDTLKASRNAENIRVAVADFNGMYTSSTSPYYAADDDETADNAGLNNTEKDNVHTGTGALTAGAFVSARDLDVNKFEYTASSGTNYDYAFDAIYQLGHAIKKQNAANNENRDLFVLFMSDGAPNQYNFYRSIGGETATSGSANWNYWLQGTARDEAHLQSLMNCNDHLYYYDWETGNQHRMANAVKGSPDTYYKVIRKATTGLDDVLGATDKKDIFTLPGLGATMYSIAFDIANDGRITAESVNHVLHNIPSSQDLYYEASTEGALQSAFTKIAGDIAYAASNARFVDQMGDSFNLQMNPTIKTNASGSTGTIPTNTDITITTRPVYTKDQVGKTVDGHTVTTDDIGKPYGNGTTVETVKFTVTNGVTTATTSVGGYTIPDGNGGTQTVTANSTNILVGNVIYGKNFFYNNNNAAVNIKLANGSTYSLPGETFYWNIGTINETLYTISYTVYLEGSLDGAAPPSDSYDTNNFAILYYTNHVGNEVSKSVASPSLAWLGANVSYAFYLVNDEGTPVHADGTVAQNFLLSHKITQPVVYKSELLLNNAPVTLSAQALAVLPSGYELFDNTATYTVQVGSGDGQGSNVSHWQITGNSALPATTYVVGFGGANDYSKEQNVSNTSYDYTHTTVYFAVKWVIGAVQDTVVIDYGLPVDINVMYNDMFGSAGTLTAVGLRSAKPEGHTNSLTTGFGTSVPGTYGTAALNNGKIRYTLNDMQIKGAEKLAYAVDYQGEANKGFYYGDLTVIPATTVYYEDEYVTLKTYTRPDTTTTNYTPVDGWPTDSVAASGVQAEDRPGSFNLDIIDANNIYGFDQAYEKMSTHSMGNSAMIHVDAKQYGTAEFSFWGTGFDVISTTSNTTGTMVVQIYDSSNKLVKSSAVDTYYGYTYGLYNVTFQKIDGVWTLSNVGAAANPDDEGVEVKTKHEITSGTPNADGTITGYMYTWKPVTNDPNALYQVPVIQHSGLPYGNYKVKITALYYETFDATTVPGYDLYLDAIRIYNPAGTGDEAVSQKTNADGTVTDVKISDIYAQDGEAWPSYYELRNLILSNANATFDALNGADEEVEGIIFIDGNEALTDDNSVTGSAITDYKNFGPNNELYLAKDQAVAFNMNLGKTTDHPGHVPVVRIGLKTVGGKTAVAEMWNAVVATDRTVTRYNAISDELKTATDMYYDITVLNGRTVVIKNSGEEGSILSITNIKLTYKPTTTSTAGINEANTVTEPDIPTGRMFTISRSAANAALMTLAEPQVEIPETPAPEETVPETTVPEETVPEETKPAKPDSSDLKESVEAAKALKEKDYTKDSYKAVKSALKAAEKVLKDKKASQAKIDAALEALNDAIAALEAKPDNSELKAAVDAAKKLKEKDYSQESFKQLKNALTAAEKVLNDKKASQAEIDEALANLNAAVDGLKTVDVKPIPPKPGASGDNVKNGFKVLESIMNVFINLLKGNNR